MKRNTRRRPKGARRATFAAVALMMGGGGLVAANVYASATEGSPGGAANQQPYSGGDGVAPAGAATIACPDVGQQLTDVPSAARAAVDKELANLDRQVVEAYARLASTRQEQHQDASFVQNAVLGPLEDKRTAVIERIAMDLHRAGAMAPGQLGDLAKCTASDGADQGGQNGGGQDGGGQDGGNQNGGG
ncbi:hypothetical protein ACL02U_03005, partial [Streptomyces sp. MS06]